jgi:hypothetical protein
MKTVMRGIELMMLMTLIPALAYSEAYFYATKDGYIFDYHDRNAGQRVGRFKAHEMFIAAYRTEGEFLLVYSFSAGDKLGYVLTDDGVSFRTDFPKNSKEFSELIMEIAERQEKLQQELDKNAKEKEILKREQEEQIVKAAKLEQIRKEKAVKEAAKEAAKDAKELAPRSQERKNYASNLEHKMLMAGHDYYVSTEGKYNEVIKIKYVLVGRPFCTQFVNSDMPDQLKKLGFRKVIMSNGYDFTITWNLQAENWE